ncbi:MAG TPA: serine/threonine protein kinase [Planctomycetaceae bacterium]|nr:serine/threonine protein kinase [Planctomycetaceae bacterium]
MSTTTIERLGSYRLINVVNTGQTSRLYQAYDDEKREPVAIKTLLDRYAADKEQIGLLQREHAVAEKLSHPLLIGVREFDWNRSPRIPFLVMEWFAAPNVKAAINRGYESYAGDLEMIFSGMLASLMYLHEQGWVHRDVKPDNFLFHPEVGFKLIDFALAKRIPGGLAKLFSLKQKTQGTASYMSPEQIRGLPSDPRSDIYGLGCTFFELLTGRVPYTATSMNELLQKHISGAIPAVTAKNKNVTPEMGNLIRAMLAKKPDDRPKTIKELIGLLQGLRLFRRPPGAGDVV